MKEKTAKALYALLKELYQSRTAKDFVDVYEHEEREQRYKKQTRELTSEEFECLLKLAEAVRRKLLPDHVIPDNVCDEEKHEARAVPVKWSVEKDNAYHALTEAIFKRKPLLTVQKAAETFVDICRREERAKPEISDVYRDIFGNRYTVLNVVETFHDETGINRPFVALLDMDKGRILTPTLEDFLNPTFKKVWP